MPSKEWPVSDQDIGVARLHVLYGDDDRPRDVRIKNINGAYSHIVGLARTSVEGRLFSEIFGDLSQADPDYVSIYGHIARNGGEASFTTWFEFSGKWLHVYAYRTGTDECTVVFADITAQRQAEQALRSTEERQRLILNSLAEGLIVVDVPSLSMHWNRKALELHGYTEQDERMGGMKDIAQDYRLLSLDGQEMPTEQWPIHRLLRGEAVRDFYAVLWNVPQDWRRDVSFGGVLVRGDDGQPLMALLTISDMSDRRRVEHARDAAERRLRLAMEIAHLGEWEWSVAEDKVYLSPQWKALLGYTEEELPDRVETWIERLHPEDAEAAKAELAAFVESPQGAMQSEYRIRHRDGSYRWMIARAIAEVDHSGHAVKLIGTMLDITQQKDAEQRIVEAAQHDALTGLPNRALIFEYASHLLAAASRQHSRGALLFIDLDRFKPVNDMYGHEIGDRLLKQVAQRMRDCVRHEDLIGRLGGDEFVIMLPWLGRGYSAPTVAQHVIDALSRPFMIDGIELSISASIGISFYPLHGIDVDALIHCADLAMYRAKEVGRGRWQVYTQEMSQRVDLSSSIEISIREGLAANQFCLHYQPVVDVDTGRVVAAEALLRLPLEHRNGEVGPGRFIAVAESSGMIAPLGDWVATEICRQQRAWADQGLPPLPVAMNISPLQFRQRGFARRLLAILGESCLDPGLLQVEVTENALIDRVDEAIEVFNQLHAAGIRIALDDFGCSGLGLATVGKLPLDKLKVDYAFVHRLAHDRGSQAVADAIISMGRALGLEIVGEGVEDGVSRDYLRAHGCSTMQGNLFSAPLPPEQFAHWLREHGLAQAH